MERYVYVKPDQYEDVYQELRTIIKNLHNKVILLKIQNKFPMHLVLIISKLP